WYGNGEKRLILAKEGSPVTSQPVDGTSYTANSTFGLGDEVVPGEFVVYNGTGGSGWIYGLQPQTTYYFKVFEYNGSDTETFYLTTADSNENMVYENSQATVDYPTVQSSNIQFSNLLGTSMTVSWTPGDGHGRILIARANSPVDVEPQNLTNYTSWGGGFGNSLHQIGTGNYVLYSSSGSSVNLTNLEPNTTYHFALFEYNGNSGKVYLTTTSDVPTPGATGSILTNAYPTLNTTNMTFTDIDGNRFYRYMSSSWYGNGEKRLILAKEGSPVTSQPVDGTSYTANSTFGLGDEVVPGEFVVYNGTGGSGWIYGLQPQTTYYFKVFEYNGSDTETFYLTTADSNENMVYENSQATVDYPTVQSSNIQFSNLLGTSMTVSWTPGDGHGRILIARANSPVDVEPQNLTNYTSWGGGFGNSSHQIGTGNYVLYSSSGSSVNLTNLEPNTTYHFALFEYNGNSGKVYLTTTSDVPTPGATGSILTNAYPTLNTTNMTFTAIDGNRFYRYMSSSWYG